MMVAWITLLANIGKIKDNNAAAYRQYEDKEAHNPRNDPRAKKHALQYQAQG
jgi:hypothetical protein